MSVLFALAMNAFVYSAKVDPITDQQSHMVALFTDEFSLAFKCDQPGKGSIYAVYSSEKYLGGGRNPKRPFTIRFGKNTPFEGWWNYDGNTATVFGDENVLALMDEAFVSSSVAVRAIRYDMAPITQSANYEADIADAKKLIRMCDPTLVNRVVTNKKR